MFFKRENAQGRVGGQSGNTKRKVRPFKGITVMRNKFKPISLYVSLCSQSNGVSYHYSLPKKDEGCFFFKMRCVERYIETTLEAEDEKNTECTLFFSEWKGRRNLRSGCQLNYN